MLKLAILLVALSPPALCASMNMLAEDLAADPSLVDVTEWEGLSLDFRYATTNNFTGKNIYQGFQRCFLHRKAAEALKITLESLKHQRPNWKLRAYDCLRPNRVQEVFWELVKNTPQRRYVQNPAKGSVHSFGLAMDVTLSDENGKEVDMGTAFDHFGPLAEPVHEKDMLRNGQLTKQQLANRKLLRTLMQDGGFIPITQEWWHFDRYPLAEVRSKFKKIE